MSTKEIFTIGHSNRTLESFVQLLRQHQCSLVADVRSTPYSQRFSHFNRELLGKSLEEHEIEYVFLGKELGARRNETTCYVDGVARYDLIARAPDFTHGIDCLITHSHAKRIAMMCSERDPIVCHRCILIARNLAAQFSIMHIIDEGKLESHQQTEDRLLRLFGSENRTLFETREELLVEAYARQGEKLAYRTKFSTVPGECHE